MFINFSNHPSVEWSDKQKEEACLLGGEIVDIPFPAILAGINEQEIDALADEYTKKILSHNPACVMCQGEFTLAFAVIIRLIDNNISVVAACSERKTIMVNKDGVSVKQVIFNFERFRKYIK